MVEFTYFFKLKKVLVEFTCYKSNSKFIIYLYKLQNLQSATRAIPTWSPFYNYNIIMIKKFRHYRYTLPLVLDIH